MTQIRAAEDAPRGLPGELRAQWRALTSGTEDAAEFEPGMVSALPEPARRWLTHAIAPGTSLRRVAVFTQHGQIKVGRWQRFEADWVLAPPDGFIWAARTQVGPVSITGFDRYTGGVGEMRWRLFGVVPFIGATGADVSRSAMGRLAAELCFVPAAALSPALRWEEIDRHSVAVHVDAHGWSHRVTLTIGSSGALSRVDIQRWGNPDRKPFREHRFSAILHSGERTFAGFTIPAQAYAGWWECPDGCADESFIRFTIDDARYV